MTLRKMTDIDLHNQRVLIREDLNVPIENGRVMNDARLRAVLPTVKLALEKGAKVILMSHLGRPKEGEFDAAASLAPVATALSGLLGQPVTLAQHGLKNVHPQPGEVILLENVRFLKGETSDDEDLARQLASLCDIFVMDAFATAHRAQASTHNVARFAPIACAGPLLLGELNALSNIMHQPARPLIAIVGGSKVSTKLEVLTKLVKLTDHLIVGGGIANTFIAAKGYGVGKSLLEVDLIDTAKRLLKETDIPLPVDVKVAKAFSADAAATLKKVNEVADDEMILDIGPETAAAWDKILKKAKTILWNGPVGVFEFPAFSEGTQAIAQSIAQSKAFSVAGGGDTLAAIEKFGIEKNLSYISTGGGAFLEFIEGKVLPGVAVLDKG